jgi:hypothetical protein
MSENTEKLSTTHTPLGTHPLWNTKGEHLPDYQENVAAAILKKHPELGESAAIAIARASIDKWQNSTHPEVMKAAKADHAAWDHLKEKHSHDKPEPPAPSGSVYTDD